ncbi:AraC family transcriptional regulator [Microbacterium karelineae]|uniref:AraC family transcriptional regulator n=1 Tax=Microbacterium karelineae TaxID=2654283 RepID=UPI0012E9F0D5|nr:AraC family transcriptional regulator [Microbacterium karelineae]
MTISIPAPSSRKPVTSDRADNWQDAERRLAALDIQTMDGTASLNPTLRVRSFGDLQIYDWQSGPFTGTRSAQLAASGEQALLVVSASSGTQIVEGDEGTVVATRDKLLLVTTRLTGRVVAPAGLDKRVVRIPLQGMARFDTAGPIPDILLLDPHENALAGLARSFVGDLDITRDAMAAGEIDSARSALLVLVAGAIRTARVDATSGEHPLQRLRQRLETWIVRHLTEGSIKVSELADAHSVAVRTVHRAFAASGDTVGSVVRAHRLAAARHDLVNTSLPITAIAHRWGFCDPSHLGRLFRDTYSMSPGEYRGLFTGKDRHPGAV